MIKKPKLLVFSQCFMYGGSERLMLSIISNKIINYNYKLIFSYGYFKEYKLLLNKELIFTDTSANINPLYLLSNGHIFFKIDLNFKNKTVRKILKLPLFIVDKFKIYDVWNCLYLTLYIFILKPQIIHVNNGGYPGSKICNQLVILTGFFFKRIKIVYQINNTAVIKNSIFTKFNDYLIQRATYCFLTHSISNKEALIRRGFTKIPIISFKSFFNENKTAFSYDFKKNQINKISIVQIGQLTERKGQLYLIKAIEILKNRSNHIYNDIHLNLIGDGEHKYILNNYIIEKKLESNITIWGSREDYINFIKSADIFIISSTEAEDLPLVLISALKYSRAIISTKIAGISEVLTNMHDSILINPDIINLSENIYKSIIELILNTSLKNKIVANTKSTYNNYFSEENYSKSLMNLYTSNPNLV